MVSTFETMKHRGEIVEQAVRKSGMTVTSIAKKLGKSRRWMYDCFETKDLSLDHIIKIGKIIHYDFSDDFPELGRGKKEAFNDQRPPYPQHDADFWREKYYTLLEEHNQLLKSVSK